MQLINYLDKSPKITSSAYIADGVKIIGDVSIGAFSSIWFNSVIRGDVARVEIGSYTNIQDGSVIHTSRDDGPTIIGDKVTIGHKAMIHACTIHSEAFIGMSAVILDKAIIEKHGFVAAGAVISPGKIVKSGELWAGVPAKPIRKLSKEEITEILTSSDHYVKLAQNYASKDINQTF